MTARCAAPVKARVRLKRSARVTANTLSTPAPAPTAAHAKQPARWALSAQLKVGFMHTERLLAKARGFFYAGKKRSNASAETMPVSIPKNTSSRVCPSSSFSTGKLTPDNTKQVAKVCLRSWNRQRLIPAFRSATAKLDLTAPSGLTVLSNTRMPPLGRSFNTFHTLRLTGNLTGNCRCPNSV